MKKEAGQLIRYFARNISIVIGLVLVWRGIWYSLDFMDMLLFDGNHAVSVVLGFIAGLLILYLPDKDLEESEKL